VLAHGREEVYQIIDFKTANSRRWYTHRANSSSVSGNDHTNMKKKACAFQINIERHLFEHTIQEMGLYKEEYTPYREIAPKSIHPHQPTPTPHPLHQDIPSPS
jgi:hypothetical protein